MTQEIVNTFREWAIQQVNNEGVLYKPKSISNYHSSLNTILSKLDLKENSGYIKIYECVDIDEYEKLYEIIFNHHKFKEFNDNSNHTHSSALKLYRRFLAHLDGEKKGPISESEIRTIKINEQEKARSLSDDELEKRVNSKKSILAKEKLIISKDYGRDQEIAEYAIRRANGKCDLCGCEAPFVKKDGSPYLEAHHVTWLSRGGEDSANNIVAICPNCHRKIHILDEKQDNEGLRRRLQSYERLVNKNIDRTYQSDKIWLT